MHSVEAGDVPLEEIMEWLLSPEGVANLTSRNGVACFALVRSITAPSFFRALVENVDLIDATTRQNVGFFVFHGNSTSLLSPGERCNYEYRVDGLSASENPYVRLGSEFAMRRPRFDEDVMDDIRAGAGPSLSSKVRRTSDAAVTYLCREFGVREADLPGLLFLGSHPGSQRLFVRLDDADPLRSLHRQVLAPLSDSFLEFEDLWKQSRPLGWRREALAAAPDREREYEAEIAAEITRVSELTDKLKIASADFADANDKLEKFWETLRESGGADFIEAFRRAEHIGERLEACLAFNQNAVAIKSCNARLIELSGQRYALAGKFDAEAEAERVNLTRLFNKQKGRLGTLLAETFARAEIGLRAAEHRVGRAKNTTDEIAFEIQRARDRIKYASEAVSKQRRLQDGTEARAIQSLTKSLEDKSQSLRVAGFPDGAFDGDSTSSRFSVIRHLHAVGKLGLAETSSSKRGLRVLMVSANPLASDRLDLEEEVREITQQTSGGEASGIEFKTALAARPEDLVDILRDWAPEVVHFSGHRTRRGFLLRNGGGKSVEVPADRLARVLSGRGVRLLVLNACQSLKGAVALSDAVEMVVGSTRDLDDDAAVKFSRTFYRTIRMGHSVSDALRDGRDAAHLAGLDDPYSCLGDLSVRLVMP